MRDPQRVRKSTPEPTEGAACLRRGGVYTCHDWCMVSCSLPRDLLPPLTGEGASVRTTKGLTPSPGTRGSSGALPWAPPDPPLVSLPRGPLALALDLCIQQKGETQQDRTATAGVLRKAGFWLPPGNISQASCVPLKVTFSTLLTLFLGSSNLCANSRHLCWALRMVITQLLRTLEVWMQCPQPTEHGCPGSSLRVPPEPWLPGERG